MSTNIEAKNNLEKIGLSDKEATVYLTLLELGSSGVTIISQKAGINRTTGYDILGSLVAKGLVNALGKGNRQEFMAENPVAVINYLKRQRNKIEEDIKKTENLVPNLLAIQSKGSKPSVKFYEGDDGLVKVYEDTLTSKETIRGFANVDEMHDGIPGYFPKYYKRRAGRNIGAKAIVHDSPLARERIEVDKEEKRTTYLIPKDKYNFSPEINIYDNKIMIASWKEKLGIIIESEEIADALKKIFELSWIGAGTFKENIDKNK